MQWDGWVSDHLSYLFLPTLDIMTGLLVLRLAIIICYCGQSSQALGRGWSQLGGHEDGGEGGGGRAGVHTDGVLCAWNTPQ